ncbi:MAG: enoyl-[acyl-carrier-protein] reductase FabL [Candidatus Kapaibacteriales bacterium]
MKKNTYAIILGVSSGFGKATALQLAKEGYNIYGLHLDRGQAKKDAETFRQDIENNGVRAVFFNANAASDDVRAEVIEQIKKDKAELEDFDLRVVIHSLAFGVLKFLVHADKAQAATKKQIEMTMDVMANSLIYWVQDLFSENLLSNNSRIMAFTSIGATKAMYNYGAVSAAKAALESYVRQLAVELAPYGITSNSIHAGLTDTPAASKIPGFASMIKLAKIQNPMKRVTTEEDVAKTVSKLADPDFNWINGEVIRVDGGDAIFEYYDWDEEAEGAPAPSFPERK